MSVRVELPGVVNVRAVGDGRPFLYRSGTLDGITSAGVATLAELGIGLVVDLRDGVERDPARLPALVAHVPVYGDLPAGPPRTGSLRTLYRRLLDEHGDALADAVRWIARSTSPVLVHCTAGKDRTGLVVALALRAAGRPTATVVDDYALSEAEVRPARAAEAAAMLEGLELAEQDRRDALDLHLASPPDALREALDHLDAAHGGAVVYLLRHGLTAADVDALGQRLGGRGAEPVAIETATAAASHRFDPEAHVTVLHLSDIHATATGPLYGRVDGVARLRAAAEHAARAGLSPEVVVVTGDLVQAGHAAAYRPLREAFDHIERLFGVPLVAALGNHDDAAAFGAAFGATRPRYGERSLPGVRVLHLDSSTGALDAEQLGWLAGRLREPHAGGTVLALHHPPLASPLPALAARGLADPDALAELLAGSDVRVVLAGHYHHALAGQLAGVPVWAGPALAYQQVMSAGPDLVSGQDLPMYSIVKLSRRSVVAAPVTLHEAEALFTVPAGSATTPRATAAATSS